MNNILENNYKGEFSKIYKKCKYKNINLYYKMINDNNFNHIKYNFYTAVENDVRYVIITYFMYNDNPIIVIVDNKDNIVLYETIEPWKYKLFRSFDNYNNFKKYVINYFNLR